MNEPIKAFLLSLGLAGVWFWLQGDLLLNLADEGFLWYGAWRTSLGEVPMRDFQAYDPGRYYWIAGWSSLFGKGIMGQRAAVALFQVAGLTAALLALRRVIRSWWGLAPAGLLLLVWMYPRHKMFEHGIAMMAVYAGVLLLERPSALRHFGAGVFVGLAAFFGRNHGVYGFVSFLALILLIRYRGRGGHLPGKLAAWGAGIAAGYAPMMLLLFLSPGFWGAFSDSIAELFRIGGTNLPLPVPWPWTLDGSTLSPLQAARAFAVGILYLLVPAGYLIGGAWLVLSRKGIQGKRIVPVAAVFVGAAYMHHAFSRAGLSHLAQGIHPFLLGAVSVPFLFRRKFSKVPAWTLVGLAAVLTWFSVIPVSPFYQTVSASPGTFGPLAVSGDTLKVYRSTADLVGSVERIYERVGPEERLLIAPHWPGFYPLLGQPSPVWEIYFLFPETPDRQEEMIRAMDEEDVHWVILGDVPLDGRDELRFRHTHGLLWDHIMTHFEPIPAEGLPWNYQLLKRKND